MKAYQIICSVCCAFLLAATAQTLSNPSNDGYVPDSTTAIRIAKAVLIPVYGEKKVESERPFKATLKTGIWTVHGTLHCPDGKSGITTSCVGGTAKVNLMKSAGPVLQVSESDARICATQAGDALVPASRRPAP